MHKEHLCICDIVVGWGILSTSLVVHFYIRW